MYSSSCSVTSGQNSFLSLSAMVNNHLCLAGESRPRYLYPTCRPNLSFELPPRAVLAVLVAAAEPQSTPGSLPDVGPCPVTTAVLGDPGTDDLVLVPETVRDLAQDLDVLKVRPEIHVGAVIALLLLLWRAGSQCGDRLVQDLRLPRKSPGELTDHHIHLRMTLVIGRPWRPQDRGEAGLAGITPGPARKSAVHRDGPLHCHRLREEPVQMPPACRRADCSRRLGSVFGEVSVVFVEPQTPHRGDRVRREAIASLTKQVHAEVRLAAILRLGDEVV